VIRAGTPTWICPVAPAICTIGIGVSPGWTPLSESLNERSVPQPESVPINQLVKVAGTPLADAAAVDPFDFVRIIAVARILMPASHVRLSAGREQMSDELQALCFMAGANSIFYGEKLLTTGNPGYDADMALLEGAGLKALEPRLETAPGS
jgi:biotin synthase